MDNFLATLLSVTGMSETSIGKTVQSVADNATLNNIFMLVVTLYLSLKLLGMAYRTIMSFVWWGAFLGVALLALWAYQQGVGTVAGTLWGLGSTWLNQAEKVVDESPYLKMGKQFLDHHSQVAY